MATYNFIKPTPSGGLPSTVAVGNASLPATSRGTPLSVYMQPAMRGTYPASDVVSYTTDNTAPSYSGMQGFLFNTNADRFRFGGQLTTISGFGFNQINGATAGTGAAISGFSIDVVVSGTDIAFHCFSYGNTDYMVLVDNMPMTLGWQHFANTVDQSFIKIKFATSRTRNIRVLLGQTGFGQALVPGTGAVWPGRPRFKACIIGDSYTQGAGGLSEGTITAGSLAGELAIRTGWEVWNMGQGGTGYQNPGNSTTSSPGPNGMDYFGATTRMNALAALPSMDLVMMWGGANDASFGTFPMATTVSRANAVWSAIRAARPNTPLVVGGIESGVYPGTSADLDTLNNALSSAAASNSAVTAYVDQRNPEKWVSGTGKLTGPTGDGNADIFVSSDGTHPTHAGWGYVAERATRAMLNIRI